MKTALAPPTISVGVYDEWSAPAALAGDCRGYLTYLVTDGEYLKIGRARDVQARVRSLQTGNARPLQLLALLQIDCESELFGMFESLNVRGEWFRDDEKIRAAFGL